MDPDRRARFDSLVRAHGSQILGLLVRFVRDRSLAEDLWQEVFWSAWRRIDELRPDRDPRPFLRTLALNRAIDHTRRESVRPRLEGGHALDERPAPPEPEGGDLEEELAALPPHERAAILLYYQEGCSVAEAARALEVPTGTVKTWLFRARARLRPRFEKRSMEAK